jgi:tRNA-2-methylthio-N6-dimethylallyladenosine synthase
MSTLGERILHYTFRHNRISDKIDVYTLGCESSEWDGEKIAEIINEMNLGNDEIVLLNTCCVTETAQIISEKIAQKLKLLFPNKKIFMTGCGVTYEKNRYENYGKTIMQKDKFKAISYGYKEKDTVKKELNKQTDIIKIQDGCYNKCSYCIVHTLREHYVVPYEKIKKQIKDLLNRGKTEFQIFGTEITLYYHNGMRLAELCERILKDFPELTKINLHSLNPASKEIDRLIELIKKEPRMNNTLSLEVQSCSNEILKLMNRKYDVDRLKEINRLCDKKVQLEFELMVGFPGETDEHFQETLNTIKEIAPKNCLVHIYSRRKGTPAYDFPNQVPLEVSQKRQQILHNEINNIKKFLFDKDHANKFFKHKPKNLSNCIIKYCDLYSDEDLNRLFQELPAYINEEKEIVLINNYNNEKDVLDLDINIKLLTSVFGVKVITNLKINDDILDLIVNTPYKKFDSNFIDFCFNSRNFVNIDFDKLENSKEEDIIKLFKYIYESELENVEILMQKLIKSGNKKYLKSILKEFNICI